jgi:tetratricopeptide (TPR) repeat protein
MPQKFGAQQLCLTMAFHSSRPIGMSKAEEDDEDVDVGNVDLSKIVVNSSRKASGATSLDREKELFALKRAMTAQYSRGDYEMALRIAVELLEKSEELYGKKNPVYASGLNNIALMQKMLGEYDQALDRYTEALHVYADVQGKSSASYASTLSNLGALYRLKAADSTGMAKHQNLLRADEALTDSLKLRQEILGVTHRDSITSEVLLAGLRRNQGKSQEGLEMLRHALKTAKEQFSSEDVLVATIENNLGLTYKELKDYESARECYLNAALIRNKILGESHPESIICLHNLAECYHAMGREKEAVAIQEKILSFVEVEEKTQNTKQERAREEPAAPAPSNPQADLNIHTSPNSFSSSPPRKTPQESQYKPASRKRR